MNSTPYRTNSSFSPFNSIVIPVLQKEKNLERYLSVFTKDIRERFACEIILTDGGITNKTIEIAERFTDNIVQYSGEGKQGIALGRDQCAEIAIGEIFNDNRLHFL